MNDQGNDSANLPVRTNNNAQHKQGGLSEWWKAATTSEKIRIILAGLYILIPFDFIPELLLGPFGIVDDVAAMIVIIQTATAVTQRYRSVK
jgi:uncharacterized membrane protein YkvA (DUF1232 family)